MFQRLRDEIVLWRWHWSRHSESERVFDLEAYRKERPLCPYCQKLERWHQEDLRWEEQRKGAEQERWREAIARRTGQRPDQ